MRVRFVSNRGEHALKDIFDEKNAPRGYYHTNEADYFDTEDFEANLEEDYKTLGRRHNSPHFRSSGLRASSLRSSGFRDISRKKPEHHDIARRVAVHDDSSISFSRSRSSVRARPGAYKLLPVIVIIAACILALSIFTYQFRPDYGLITIDVNPGFDIYVDRSLKITSIRPVDMDATQMLQGTDFKGWNLITAINTICASMIDHGYLDSAEDYILVSAEYPGGASELLGQLSSAVNSVLYGKEDIYSVYALEVKHSGRAEKAAKANGISVGKLALINLITDEGYTKDTASLATESIAQLVHMQNDLTPAVVVTPSPTPTPTPAPTATPTPTPTPTPWPTPTNTPAPTPTPEPATPTPVPFWDSIFGSGGSNSGDISYPHGFVWTPWGWR
jgi:hypothetical protein